MGMIEDLESTSVRELNIRPPVTISVAKTVRDAVVTMREAGLGCVVVVDDEEKAVGILTEGMLRHDLNESPTILDDALENQMVARFRRLGKLMERVSKLEKDKQ